MEHSYGEWLKLARNFRGITAQQLADTLGVSLSCIQRVEGGSRRMSEKLMERSHEVLGFTLNEVSFDSEPLLAHVDELIEKNGPNVWCTPSFFASNGRRYYTGCEVIDVKTLRSEADDRMILSLGRFRSEVETQISLYELAPSLLSGLPVALNDDQGGHIGTAVLVPAHEPDR